MHELEEVLEVDRVHVAELRLDDLIAYDGRVQQIVFIEHPGASWVRTILSDSIGSRRMVAWNATDTVEVLWRGDR